MATTEWITLRCETKDCTDFGTSMPRSIADRYRELGVPYRCHKCLAAERNGRAQAARAILNSTSKERSDIFDNYGRVRL